MSNVITRIEEIVTEINTKLDIIHCESIAVGTLLIEAKEELQEQGKKYADFIEWCSLHFSIGKAQASKLMRVATFFKDDKRFVGVAMRVLYSLATNATPDQLERAAEFAASGTLDSGVLHQLLNPTPIKTEETEDVNTVEGKEEASKELEEALNNIPLAEDSDVPFELDKKVSQGETSNDDTLLQEIQELRKSLAEANKLIQEMSNAKIKHNTSATSPFLPQFKNACPYAVLGLGQVESKQITKVRSAFRALIKCGYGDGHEAFELITKAKDALLSEIDKEKESK